MEKVDDASFSMYVVTHRPFHVPNIPGYLPIAVGSLAKSEGCSYLRDSSGDNITARNANYCELTAQYWIWKNAVSSDVMGMCHYRRYFSTSWLSCSPTHYLREKETLKILKHHDIILPKSLYWPKRTVGENYFEGGMGRKKDLVITRKVIEECEHDYLASFDEVLSAHAACYCNMFVTTAHLFDAYTKWLFRILFKAEQLIDLTGYSIQEARVFGYLSELLLNVWVQHNRLTTFGLRVVNTDKGFSGNLKDELRQYGMKKKTLQGGVQ